MKLKNLLLSLVVLGLPGVLCAQSGTGIQQPAHVYGAFTVDDCVKINANGFLVTNGAACGGGGGTPGGMDTAIQFNDGGAFGGDATNFSYDKTTYTQQIGSPSHTGILNVYTIEDGSCCLNQLNVGQKTLIDYLRNRPFPGGINTTITADLYDAIVTTITGGAEGCMAAGCIATYWGNWGYNSAAATPGKQFFQTFAEYEFHDDGTKYLNDWGFTRCNTATEGCNNGGDEANWFYIENGHAAGFASLPLEGTAHANAYSANLYKTETNCSDSAGAAACGSAAAGAFVIDAASTSVVVSTIAVTANSEIIVVFDSSLGTRLGITCNTTVALPSVTARTAATSFTVTIPAAPVTNPACYNYFIIN